MDGGDVESAPVHGPEDAALDGGNHGQDPDRGHVLLEEDGVTAVGEDGDGAAAAARAAFDPGANPGLL